VRNAPTPSPAPTPTPVSETSSNPYAAASTTLKDSGGFEGAPRERGTGRSFRFNPKGKYVQLGNEMRRENQLEALKQRIAESAKKAGLDSEFETLEKNIRVSV
jgi:U4/U6 small nuclear ribonucleoprotein PRP3